ncbi:hypothetical protein CBW21_05965 [Chromobacterium violaceum]|uniref:HipA-like kinase domain-containing protein n=2 Tax=Chromobacterium violaceum TaxID=536 RepID=A0A202BCZ8_CHRVL|nr:hypothetical protein CBW21_05965 [Chromobacterium violaceum]
MSEELYEELTKDLKGIGKGMLFGLQECPSVRWFEAADVHRTTKAFRRDLLVFDYWISNEDRIPYNSNLLYSDTENKVIVIDHNRAFIEHLSRNELVGQHIFSEEWPEICVDWVSRAQYEERIEHALHSWDTACGYLPPYWRYENDECDILVNFDIDQARTQLERFRSQDFWEAI